MNGIPIHILKISKQILSPFLSQLFNRCAKTGIYPECLKCAQVIPIQKEGQKNNCTNYRPISLLPPFNKIFEKLVPICTLMLNKIRCYMTLTTDFVLDCLQ